MIRELSGTRPLSVILKPVPDELLSSWITRHADFHGVPPLTMLRHAIPEATSLRQTDTNLGPTAAVHIARLFRSQFFDNLGNDHVWVPTVGRAARRATRHSMLHRLLRAIQIARSCNCGTAKLDRGLADNLSRLQTTAGRDEGGGHLPSQARHRRSSIFG
ncbi:TniQ family protein [Mesorhizobium vachelliae]|uniref:TniQ family protein n=1 Tax=Mesorhizobium vachelliae TaxID=3072309 RepID=UPI003D315641